MVLAIVTVIGFVAWLIWELTDEHPDRRSVAVQVRAISPWARSRFCLGYAVFFGNIVLMPLWLQTQLGYTATWAGLVAAPSRRGRGAAVADRRRA